MAALLFALRAVDSRRYSYRLNGLLLGAALCTGFAAFESAGYALRFGLVDAKAMLNNIQVREILSPFGHIAWTAIAASAYWIARPEHHSLGNVVLSSRFLKLFTVPVVLHFIWNLPLDGPFFAKYIVLGFVACVVVISLVQSGLKEITAITKEREPNANYHFASDASLLAGHQIR